jgi:hypothetical protein
VPYPLSADPEAFQVALTLLAIAAILALGNRRLVVVPLMLQYVLVAALLAADASQPVFLIRVTLGVAISTILYITGHHMTRNLAAQHRSTQGEGRVRALFPPRMVALFRLVALLWAMLMAFGLWHAYPVANLPPLLTLAAMVLLLVGPMLAIVSSDPLHVGVGALVLLTGFEAVFLSLETSLLVVALLGTLDVLVALTVSYNCERWLESVLQETGP